MKIAFLFFLFYILAFTTYRVGYGDIVTGLGKPGSLLLLIPASHPNLLNFLGLKQRWMNLGIAAVIICTLLSLTPIAGWCTWSALGLFTAIFVIALATRLNTSESFLLGAGITIAFVGIWEIVYCTGVYRFHHGFESVASSALFNYEVTILSYLSCILAGLGTLAYITKRHSHFFTFNSLSCSFLLLYILCITIWFIAHMPLAVTFMDGDGPFYWHTSYIMGVVVHTSKVALVLTFLFAVKEVRDHAKNLWVSSCSYLDRGFRSKLRFSSLRPNSQQTETYRDKTTF